MLPVAPEPAIGRVGAPAQAADRAIDGDPDRPGVQRGEDRGPDAKRFRECRWLAERTAEGDHGEEDARHRDAAHRARQPGGAWVRIEGTSPTVVTKRRPAPEEVEADKRDQEDGQTGMD